MIKNNPTGIATSGVLLVRFSRQTEMSPLFFYSPTTHTFSFSVGEQSSVSNHILR